MHRKTSGTRGWMCICQVTALCHNHKANIPNEELQQTWVTVVVVLQSNVLPSNLIIVALTYVNLYLWTLVSTQLMNFFPHIVYFRAAAGEVLFQRKNISYELYTVHLEINNTVSHIMLMLKLHHYATSNIITIT